MTREEFLMLAEAWGADISRWPHHRQDAAMQFAVTDAGVAILEEARRFDCLLSIKPEIGSDRTVEAAFAVMQRVAAERDARWTDWLPNWWVPTSVACSALIGISLAVAIPPSGSGDQPEVTIDLVLDSGTASVWSAR